MRLEEVDQPSDWTVKARRAREKAESLYPLETWREIEKRLYIAGSREPRSNNQEKVLEKELIQARILTARGSTVYLLPETADPAQDGVKHPDAVADGYLMEFKTITGGIRQIEEHFKESRKKADYVFFKVNSNLTQEAVLSKLIDKVRKSGYSGGMAIVHFTASQKTYFWDVDSLK